jgi:hypothetical protein
LATGLFCGGLQAKESSIPENLGSLQPVLKPPVVFNLQSDSPSQLAFFGSDIADLFTKEVRCRPKLAVRLPTKKAI